MLKQSPLPKIISFGILTFSLVVIYLATLAPGLTWANDGSDGGDLITATAIGGVAHPSGYPIYMLLARGFQLLPIGSLAFRTNLMSAFFAVMTSLLVYALVERRVILELEPYQASIAGLGAGFATGLAPLLWSQAVITEVYTLHAFFIALTLYLIVNRQPRNSTRLDRVQGVVYGLAACNHLTSMLVIPGAIVASCVSRFSSRESISGTLPIGKDYSFNWKAVTRQLIWMVPVLLIYLILPLRAMNHPAVNWGNPITIKNFWWLVSGQTYRFFYLQDNLQLWPRIQATANLLLQQFGLLGIVLGFVGLVMTFKPSRLQFLTIWNAMVFSLVTVVYQSVDSYVYFIPVIISFSIWIGLCIVYLTKYLIRLHKIWIGAFVVILLIYFTYGLVSNWQSVDASHDDRAETFGNQVYAIAPENAIVFAEGDKAVFTLWYFHFALGQRPDVSVVASDLLHWDWYLNSLKSTYPSLNLTIPFPWPSTIESENPGKPVCYIRYSDEDETEISCED